MKFLKLLKLNLPFVVSFVIILAAINITINAKLWKGNRIIVNDVVSYYGYLPATFIYHDYTMNFLRYGGGEKDQHQFTFWPENVPNGGMVFKTSMGMAYLYAPFFFAADYYANGSNYDAGGFSLPYQVAIAVCSLFFFAMGLFFLSKMLLRFFNPYISSLIILITTAGSNLFHYVTFEQGMSHPFSFTLIALFIWFTIKWHENPRYLFAAILGVLIGLISLIRPTNIVVSLFFLLYGIVGKEDIKTQFMLFLSRYKHLIIIAILFLLVWFPQLMYWKSITGSFLYFSYTGERFFFDHPRILKGFFSYRNGWLVYSPAMIFSVIGLFFVGKLKKELRIALIATFVVFVYIIFSWWCWWYGGSFGNRAMIDIYGMLALSAGAFFSYIANLKYRWINYSGVFVILLLVAVGIHHLNKSRSFSIHFDSMTKDAFWDHYLERKPSPTFESKLRKPDYNKAKLGIDAYDDESK